MVGVTPSMTNALFPANELALSIAGKVKVASLVAASLMVPLFKAKELVWQHSSDLCLCDLQRPYS